LDGRYQKAKKAIERRKPCVRAVSHLLITFRGSQRGMENLAVSHEKEVFNFLVLDSQVTNGI
jgi:hypothetical protein